MSTISELKRKASSLALGFLVDSAILALGKHRNNCTLGECEVGALEEAIDFLERTQQGAAIHFFGPRNLTLTELMRFDPELSKSHSYAAKAWRACGINLDSEEKIRIKCSQYTEILREVLAGKIKSDDELLFEIQQFFAQISHRTLVEVQSRGCH